VEAIETISAGATLARVLRVRAAGGAIGGRVARETLAALAAKAGAELRDIVPPEARFAVADDAGAARLIEALVAGGVPVAEATPEESRLERLFLDASGSTGSGGAVPPPVAPPPAAPQTGTAAPRSPYAPPGSPS
jgi:hypothetical protein